MIQWREGRVVRERARWAGAVELEVAVVGAPGYLGGVLGEVLGEDGTWASRGSASSCC
jgi:hypothetical protein